MATSEVVIKSEPTGPEAPAPVSARPNNIPAKFWNEETKSVDTEALLKSYGELEGRLGAPKDPQEEVQEQPQDENRETQDEGNQEEQDKAAEEAAEAAGVNVEELEAHFAEHGELPEDAYAKLAAAGISKELVDEYVQYRTQQSEVIQNEIVSQYGGMEAVSKMTEWAAEKWTEEKASAFNEAVASKNRAKIDMALKSLEADYSKAHPKRPSLLKPTAAAAVGGPTPFRSTDEMIRAMSDPRYRTDEAYRQEVAQRLGGMK